MKQIDDVRWLDVPLTSTSTEEDTDKETTTTDNSQTDTNTTTTRGTTSSDDGGNQESTGTEQPQSRGGGTTTDRSESSDKAPIVERDDIVKRAKDLQRGIRKIKDDVMPRYKKQETTPKDGDFVNAMYKAGLLFKSKLTQSDKDTKAEFKSNIEFLDKALPQWKELEERLRNSKDRAEMRAVLKEQLETTVKAMNEIRQQVKDILKRTNLKKLA